MRVWDADEALSVLASLCARSEQCEYDLRLKLRQHAVCEADADKVIDYLAEHRFLDHSRYARAYVRDKIRFNHWGRIKVSVMLKGKGLPACDIREAMAAFPEDEYFNMLLKRIRTAARSSDLHDMSECRKLLRRFQGRGFETSLILRAMECVKESE